MADYAFRTPPTKYQHVYFEHAKDLPAWGNFFDPGLGKSKCKVDIAAYKFETGMINGWAIVCPSSLKRTWSKDQIPGHMPERVLARTKVLVWNAKDINKDSFKAAFKQLLIHDGLAVLIMSYHAVMKEAGHKALKKFLEKRRSFYILDESQNVKTPKAKRTIRFVASSAWAPYRAILSGTPLTNGVEDAYSQVKFLEPQFWKDRGIGSFTAFKSYFCEYFTRQAFKEKNGYDPGYDTFLGYKNVAQLERWLKQISTRLTEDQAGLDLPPLRFKKRYFTLTRQQRRHYNELVNEYRTEVKGLKVDGKMTLTRIIRLQQVTRGWLGAGEGPEKVIVPIEGENPRLEITIEAAEAISGQALIWSGYTEDLRLIKERLGKSCAIFNGGASEEERQRIVEAFNAGDLKYFAGNPGAGGAGLTLLGGTTMIYHANGYNLEHRLQSQKRSHRFGQTKSVFCTDVVAEDSVDEKVVTALCDKRDIAAMALGDELKEWIR